MKIAGQNNNEVICLLNKMRIRIQAKREAREVEQERKDYVASVRRKQLQYRGACVAYESIMANSIDNKLQELAYDYMKVKERELNFMLSVAREYGMSANWDDLKIS